MLNCCFHTSSHTQGNPYETGATFKINYNDREPPGRNNRCHRRSERCSPFTDRDASRQDSAKSRLSDAVKPGRCVWGRTRVRKQRVIPGSLQNTSARNRPTSGTQKRRTGRLLRSRSLTLCTLDSVCDRFMASPSARPVPAWSRVRRLFCLWFFQISPQDISEWSQQVFQTESAQAALALLAFAGLSGLALILFYVRVWRRIYGTLTASFLMQGL